MPKFVQSRKEVSHERILQAATRAIRRSGYAGTGVADIMREAGLTHGGFYAHFDSREAMLAEAADLAGIETIGTLEKFATAGSPQDAYHTLLRTYLSRAHADRVETGCPVAALGSEMPRQAPEVRHAASLRIKDMIDLVARFAPKHAPLEDRRKALATTATMVGALIIARAVDDSQLSDEVLAAAIEQLTLF